MIFQKKLNIIIVIIIIFFKSNIFADIIYLKNGGKIETELCFKQGKEIKFYRFNGIVSIPENIVERIEKQAISNKKDLIKNSQNHILNHPKVKNLLENNKKKYYKVNYVFDGDTIVLSNKKHVRYLGINTLEIDHSNKSKTNSNSFEILAYKYNKKMVYKNMVFLLFDENKIDQYKRTLAYVFLKKDNCCVNAKLLESGYAYCLYKFPNFLLYDYFTNIQKQAMINKLGIWKVLSKKYVKLTANHNSKRFHKPECKFARSISDKNKGFFNNYWDAFFEGYAPCKSCFDINKLFKSKFD